MDFFLILLSYIVLSFVLTFLYGKTVYKNYWNDHIDMVVSPTVFFFIWPLWITCILLLLLLLIPTGLIALSIALIVKPIDEYFKK